MKTIPPILITILTFVLGIRLYMIYKAPLGIFMIFVYFCMVFITNMGIPHFVNLFHNSDTKKKCKNFFLVYSIVLFAGALIARSFLIGPFYVLDSLIEKKMFVDAFVIVILGMSCSAYNVYATLDEKIQRENKIEDCYGRTK